MAEGKTLVAPTNERTRGGEIGCRGPPRGEEVRAGMKTGKSKPREGRRGEERWAAMGEAWGIRGWSLKVWGEPLSNGSSQNESCYLILLSTLLRFIHQLLDALQYAANRARIVCRRVVLFPSLCPYSLPPVCSFSPSLGLVPFVPRYISDNRQTLVVSCAKRFVAISWFPKRLWFISGVLILLLWLLRKKTFYSFVNIIVKVLRLPQFEQGP